MVRHYRSLTIDDSAADQHALNEDHREGRPTGPHLQGIAPPPPAEVAALFEVPNLKCIAKRPERGAPDLGIVDTQGSGHRS